MVSGSSEPLLAFSRQASIKRISGPGFRRAWAMPGGMLTKVRLPSSRRSWSLPGLLFPGQNRRALESEQVFPVAGVEVIAPHLARRDGNEVKGPEQILGLFHPFLPGEEDEPPGVLMDFAG